MSENNNHNPRPRDEDSSAPDIKFIHEDDMAVVLFTGMRTFWSAYYACHARLLRHIQESFPDATDAERQALARNAVAAAVEAARQKPPTAQQLALTFRETCGPILEALGAEELLAEDIEEFEPFQDSEDDDE